MKIERHREIAVDTFSRYVMGTLPVISHLLAELSNEQFIQALEVPYIYILRLDARATLAPSVRAIPNRNDALDILYIGGHPSGKATGRFNALIASCRKAEVFFKEKGFALNDARHAHSVAGCLTTALLQKGFSISQCQLDLVVPTDTCNELEFLIGYQEMYHHLPPWNSLRGGASGFVDD